MRKVKTYQTLDLVGSATPQATRPLLDKKGSEEIERSHKQLLEQFLLSENLAQELEKQGRTPTEEKFKKRLREIYGGSRK